MLNPIFRGKFGRSAADQFSKDMHFKRMHGKLSSVNQNEEHLISQKAQEVFGSRTSFTEKEFEEKVLNPLRLNRNDILDSGEVDEIDKGFNFKYHSKRVDND